MYSKRTCLQVKKEMGEPCVYILFLSVCFYSINVKTAEPIGPKFCVGPHMTPGRVYG